MSNSLSYFERIVRTTCGLGTRSGETEEIIHPFDERNIHPEISAVSQNLFDNGHYAQATFEAFKLIDNKVRSASQIKESGYKLMMAAFSETNPKIKLTHLGSTSEVDEQLGYKHMFAGAMSAIRNPRGHEISNDHIDACLDHLSLASVLLRRLGDTVT